MKKIPSLILASLMLAGAGASFVGCSSADYTLTVYNWNEYIDEGGKDGYDYEVNGVKADALYKRFAAWYEEQTGVKVKIEYAIFETNEEFYNKVTLGEQYDLACPSDYMIMKMAAEGLLTTYDASFYDTSIETNYYAKNVSAYIDNVFRSNKIGNQTWADYAAGYMWGTTGLIYNPEVVKEEDLTTWAILSNSAYRNKITTKDNVRDSYFAALAIYHEEELLSLKARFEAGEISYDDYNARVTALMNDTTDETISAVEKILNDVAKNIYGFETDSGKEDFITGKISINFAWSGDAVYAMDVAEEDGMITCYAIPETASNLWFDGWVMSKEISPEKKVIAQAFVNFLSMPENAVRNCYYVGYTPVIAGEEMFEYMLDTYGVEEGDAVEAEYDVSYFFGEGHTIGTYEDQLSRQLFAQYPTEDVLSRLAVMGYCDAETNTRLNNMWTNIKG
ncbi:MAG: ABC transporter substrate-binding protein [Clostridia bacterium]|nr:ABC transporter substrate-binding protein [Clostridia bacterium]